MTVLDNILADTRQKIDTLRAESADHARTAHEIAEQMAVPTEAYRAMEAEHRDLLLKVAALEDEMRTARTALDAMADERDTHLHKADSAAEAADHFEQVTLPQMAVILDGAALPPREALDVTGLPVEPPKDIDPAEHTCANMGCTSCTGCDGCTCHDPAHTCLPWDVSTQTECPACREIAGNGKPVNGDNLPHLPLPVPHEPAGALVATHGPLTTMPDTGLNPAPLEPAQEGDGPRHRAPARPGLLARLTGGHPIITAQDGDT